MHAAFQVDVLYVFGKVNTPSNPKKESESEFCKHTLELFYFINPHSSWSQPGPRVHHPPLG
jgi:hypothetical protein